jgi:hypothetical protein
MPVNPKNIMKLRERLGIFQSQHPRVQPFLKDAFSGGVLEGSVIELKVTSPEGRSCITNIRLTQEDVETINMIRELGGLSH